MRALMFCLLLLVIAPLAAQPVDLKSQSPELQKAYGLLSAQTRSSVAEAIARVTAELAAKPKNAFALCEMARYEMKSSGGSRDGFARAAEWLAKASAADPERADTEVLVG